MSVWILKAHDVKSCRQWTWRLYDESGNLRGSHEVDFDPGCEEWRAFVDLQAYFFLAPERTREYQTKLLKKVGDWVGSRILGSVGDILAREAPAVVRMEKEDRQRLDDPDLEEIFRVPLEIARVDGRALVLHRIRFVLGIGSESRRHKTDTDVVRVLAVFSLPQGTGALNLRQERYRLQQQLRNLVSKGFAFDLKFLQFGATRSALEEILEEGEGWDVVHFSGHGEAALLILEDAEGRPDPVPTAEVVRLLGLTRDRLKWVTLSSCSSAAATLEETRRWLRLPVRPDPFRESNVQSEDSLELPALAKTISAKLDCAVLAMRFAVTDRFATDLTEKLHEHVFEKKQALPTALGATLAKLFTGKDAKRYPLISQAIPALFGRRAYDLKLTASRRSPSPSPKDSKGFSRVPPPPENLVGRTVELTSASRALSPSGNQRGVIFYGMAGAGKSSCAIELTRLYEDLDRFRYVVFYGAPELGKDIERTMFDFALQWESIIPELPFLHLIDHEAKLQSFLPEISYFLERNSVLLVLDNLESLLREKVTDQGETEWRNPAWAQLFAALHDHSGISRVISTSRFLPRMPAGRQGRPPAVERIPLHSLSLDEALLFARQLPNFNRLIEDQGNEGLELVRRVLEVVQGHPKLLELADRQCAEPARLAKMLAASSVAGLGGQGQLNAFFQQGISSLGEIAFQAQLSRWAASILATMPKVSRTTFQILCCLEELERSRSVLDATWVQIWRRLDQGDPPALAEELTTLERQALISPWKVGEAPQWRSDISFRIHPGIVESLRPRIPKRVQEAVDTEVIHFWTREHELATSQEILRAAAMTVAEISYRLAPYLIRRKRWKELRFFLASIVYRDESPKTLSSVIPLLRTASIQSGDISQLGELGNALLAAGRWDEAEDLLKSVAEACERTGSYRSAWVSYYDLLNLYTETAQLPLGWPLLDKLRELSKISKLGPWTSQANENQELTLRLEEGENEAVLGAVNVFLERLPSSSSDLLREEAVNPWNTYEALLHIGYCAARNLVRLEEALDFNTRLIASQKSRNSAPMELARAYYNRVLLLAGLSRSAESYPLLVFCREIYEAEGYTSGLGRVLSEMAELSAAAGDFALALDYEKSAIRYKYISPIDIEECWLSHMSLSLYSWQMGTGVRFAAANFWAALLLQFPDDLDGDYLRDPLFSLKTLRDLSYTEVCRQVGKVPGANFRQIHQAALKELGISGTQAQLKIAEAIERVRSPSGDGGGSGDG